MAGSSGCAVFLISFPRLLVTLASPVVFFSATMPLGALPFQDQEARGRHQRGIVEAGEEGAGEFGG